LGLHLTGDTVTNADKHRVLIETKRFGCEKVFWFFSSKRQGAGREGLDLNMPGVRSKISPNQAVGFLPGLEGRWRLGL
jgi:hypothetical protein